MLFLYSNPNTHVHLNVKHRSSSATISANLSRPHVLPDNHHPHSSTTNNSRNLIKPINETWRNENQQDYVIQASRRASLIHGLLASLHTSGTVSILNPISRAAADALHPSTNKPPQESTARPFQASQTSTVARAPASCRDVFPDTYYRPIGRLVYSIGLSFVIRAGEG